MLVLSGAGLSTASGIGDYRDAQGVYKRPPPITISRFLGSHAARQRYWARSLFGWPAFNAAQPNAGHRALARLQEACQNRGEPGFAVITQNVDELHQSAGHADVLELHGSLKQVECLDCGLRAPREALQQRLLAANAQLTATRRELLPDGDAELDDADFAAVVVPGCERCGGVLKPTVVFFGDSVPRSLVEESFSRVDAADALLIVGSSVMIHSGFRFCRRAHERGIPQFAVNQGRTRADDWLHAKYLFGCEVLLPAVQERQVPSVVK